MRGPRGEHGRVHASGGSPTSFRSDLDRELERIVASAEAQAVPDGEKRLAARTTFVYLRGGGNFARLHWATPDTRRGPFAGGRYSEEG